GQIGIAGIGDDVLIENNEIAFNNYAGYGASWEAGGTKFVRTNNLIVRGNRVHHNNGPGLWTDIDNMNSTISDNDVFYNTGAGI
ncbi:right-handed parallel beta-helix repeat-containing protein, partial [Klebsiella pneumoniae]|uniref:right-handed parallel beta-helix repeat-containing protein n=1 Tax=Klebsiella pneumoniae TaxID=573 RepID=UPI00272FF797